MIAIDWVELDVPIYQHRHNCSKIQGEVFVPALLAASQVDADVLILPLERQRAPPVPIKLETPTRLI